MKEKCIKGCHVVVDIVNCWDCAVVPKKKDGNVIMVVEL